MSMSLFRDRAFSLRQLQYVVAVADEGGFGKAARCCGVSQPSLSAQVAKLEDMLGVTLFERLGRGVVLTAEGRELLSVMRGLLRTAEELESRARVLADPFAATLRIGVIPTVAPYFLPQWSRALAQQFGRLTVHWVEAKTAEVESMLARGDLDGGVIADGPTAAGMRDHVVAEDPFVVVAPLEHDLTGPVTLERLSGADVLLLEEGHCLRDHALDLCLLPGVTESPFRATSLPTLVQMVGAGLGLTVLPACAVEVEVSRAPVRVVPFAEPVPKRVLRMVWRERSPHGQLLEAISGSLSLEG